MAEVDEDKEGVRVLRGGVGGIAWYRAKRGRWASAVTGVIAEWGGGEADPHLPPCAKKPGTRYL